MTASAVQATAEAQDFATRHLSKAIAAVLGGMTLVVLDSGMSNVALPTIARAFDATSADAIGISTAYQLGLVIALLPAAALGESLGLRRVFAAGVGLFTTAAILSAFSPSLFWLVAARFAQGIGGAGVMALGLALLRMIIAPDRLGAAIGWNALTVALSSAVGPALGAAILSITSWHWLFALHAPIGIGVFLLSRALPSTHAARRHIDPPGIALNACAFLLAATGAERMHAKPGVGLALLAASAFVAVVFVKREMGRPAPLLPLDLLSLPPFRRSIASSVLCFSGQTSGLIALPFYLQSEFGLSPMATGLYLLPWPLAVAVVGPLAGKLSERAPTAHLCFAGGGLLGLGLALTSALPAHCGAMLLAAAIAICGAGFGLFNVPNNRNMFLSAPSARSGAAGGLQGMARLTGQTAGALIMTFLFGAIGADSAPRMGLAIGAAFALLSGLASVSPTRSGRAQHGQPPS